MFAYSSVSQIGYIIFALGIGTPLAILGGLFHLFNHAIFKSLLFLNSGAIEYSTGTRDLKRLGGLNSRLPVSGYTGLLGSMSISGIPPLAGFWSKLIIIIAALQAGYFVSAAVAILVSIVTLAYYLKFLGFTFFEKLDTARQEINPVRNSVQDDSRTGISDGVKEVPGTMRLAMIVLAIICSTAGVLLIPSWGTFLQSAVKVLLLGNGYKDVVFGAIR